MPANPPSQFQIRKTWRCAQERAIEMSSSSLFRQRVLRISMGWRAETVQHQSAFALKRFGVTAFASGWLAEPKLA
jgi:hypothetical protein